jgi:hypothetical protein
VTLGAAVLPDQLARPPLRHPKHLLEMFDGAAPAGRTHQFPRPSSFRAWIWSSFGHDPLQPGVLALQLLQAADVTSSTEG